MLNPHNPFQEEKEGERDSQSRPGVKSKEAQDPLFQ